MPLSWRDVSFTAVFFTFMHKHSSYKIRKMIAEKLKRGVLKEEKDIERIYNVRVKPTRKYGLYKFLRSKESIFNKTISGRIFEYWTFLILLEVLLEESVRKVIFSFPIKGDQREEKVVYFAYGGEKTILYDPNRGGYPTQYPTCVINNYTIWFEPSLPRYISAKRSYSKPDFMIMKGRHEEMFYFSGAFSKDVIKMLHWRDINSNSEKIDIREEEELMKIKFKKKERQKFNKIRDDILLLIECKDGNVTAKDMEQVEQYCAKYRVPTVLLCQHEIPIYLKAELEQGKIGLYSSDIIIRENFKIGNRDTCKEIIRELLCGKKI